MQRMAKSNVFLSGMGGLGVETGVLYINLHTKGELKQKSPQNSAIAVTCMSRKKYIKMVRGIHITVAQMVPTAHVYPTHPTKQNYPQ